MTIASSPDYPHSCENYWWRFLDSLHTAKASPKPGNAFTDKTETKCSMNCPWDQGLSHTELEGGQGILLVVIVRMGVTVNIALWKLKF